MNKIVSLSGTAEKQWRWIITLQFNLRNKTNKQASKQTNKQTSEVIW